jgi:hypothetical protein
MFVGSVAKKLTEDFTVQKNVKEKIKTIHTSLSVSLVRRTLWVLMKQSIVVPSVVKLGSLKTLKRGHQINVFNVAGLCQQTILGLVLRSVRLNSMRRGRSKISIL